MSATNTSTSASQSTPTADEQSGFQGLTASSWLPPSDRPTDSSSTTAALSGTSASSSDPATSSSTSSPSPTPTSSPTSSSTPITSSSSLPTSTSTSSSSSTPSSTSTSTPITTSTSTPLTTSTSSTISSSSSPSPSSSSVFTSVHTTTSPAAGTTSTIVETLTSTAQVSTPASSSAASATSSGTPLPTSGASSGGLSTGGKIAIAVVIPIAAVALVILALLWFWRKRKARKAAEEERRKEVEEYTYNPNADPTIPAVGGAAAGAAGYEMTEDASGYRGWGSTPLAGSSGRKASTTMSGGAAGGGVPSDPTYSDAPSPTRGNGNDAYDGAHSSEGEILGAMGPAAGTTRNGEVHRGPSNASSSYSMGARSDSDDGHIGMAYGGPQYYDQYESSNPYVQGSQGQQAPGATGGQPIIRDNPARRNTRIENSSHYPQQSAGISQNF